MTRFDTPLRKRHEQYVEALVGRPEVAAEEIRRPGAATGERIAPPDVEYLPYGPRDENGRVACEIIGNFGEIQAEYAAIRNGAGLLDCPHRATIRVTGEDLGSFLNSMLTAELKDLAPGAAHESFWLNRKGRIEADLLLAAFDDVLLIDVDVHALDRTISTLDSFLFAEDVALADAQEQLHRLTIHGTRACDVIAQAGDDANFTIEDGRAATVTIADQRVRLVRCDQAGTTGLHLFVPREQTGEVWEALLATDEALSGGKRRVRPIGWHAFNIARIEAGTPLFNIDFGTDTLPHETGVLDRRVSFTKGCFLGQEVVARMQHLGKPKRTLIGLRMEDDLLPIEGASIFNPNSSDESNESQPGEQIGVVTSSTLSPMLGAQPIAFAMLRSKEAQPDRRVIVEAEGRHATARLERLNVLARRHADATDHADAAKHS